MQNKHLHLSEIEVKSVKLFQERTLPVQEVTLQFYVAEVTEKTVLPVHFFSQFLNSVVRNIIIIIHQFVVFNDIRRLIKFYSIVCVKNLTEFYLR